MPTPLASSRLSPDDAENMARLFNREHQDFNPVALQDLNIGEAHFHGGRLLVDADTYTFPRRAIVRKQSRRHYGRRRERVEPTITHKLLSLTTSKKETSTRPRRRRPIQL